MQNDSLRTEKGRNPTAKILILAAIVGLLAIISWATVSPNVSKVYAPFNLFVLVPTMLIGELLNSERFTHWGIFVSPLLFCLWALPRVWTDRPLPMRSLVLLALTVGISAVWLGFSSPIGKEYQGATHVLGVWVLNLVSWIVLGILSFLARRRASYQLNLGFHTALFAWLSWCAFPYLGEL